METSAQSPPVVLSAITHISQWRPLLKVHLSYFLQSHTSINGDLCSKSVSHMFHNHVKSINQSIELSAQSPSQSHFLQASTQINQNLCPKSISHTFANRHSTTVSKKHLAGRMHSSERSKLFVSLIDLFCRYNKTPLLNPMFNLNVCSINFSVAWFISKGNGWKIQTWETIRVSRRVAYVSLIPFGGTESLMCELLHPPFSAIPQCSKPWKFQWQRESN